MPAAICAAISSRFNRSCHSEVAFDGRIASDASTSRPPCAGFPRISTSPRLMPKRDSSACIAYCGWLEAGGVVKAPLAPLRPPIDRQASSSRSVSRPGSTTAPCGSLATASRNFAVDGIDPVEPAAITGPSDGFVRRSASASIKRSRRAAGSILLVSARKAGQKSRAIFRKSSVCCQYLSNWSGTRRSSALQSTSRVTMSSISRARSPASVSVEAGPPTTSGDSTGRLAQAATSLASTNRRSSSPSLAGTSSGAAPPGSESSENAS